MKRLIHFLTVASLAAGPVLAGNSAVGASEKQTMDAAQNTLSNGQILIVQNNATKEVKSDEPTKINVDANGVILKGCDTIAYFEQGKPIKGDSAIQSTHWGATYLFASAADKAIFEKEPSKYAPQYGGFCAYGVVKGALDDFEGLGDFVIYKGKLYLCGNQNALEIFTSNIDSNIEKADMNWRRLSKY